VNHGGTGPARFQTASRNLRRRYRKVRMIMKILVTARYRTGHDNLLRHLNSPALDNVTGSRIHP
jgi:hypothetical protein